MSDYLALATELYELKEEVKASEIYIKERQDFLYRDQQTFGKQLSDLEKRIKTLEENNNV